MSTAKSKVKGQAPSQRQRAKRRAEAGAAKALAWIGANALPLRPPASPNGFLPGKGFASPEGEQASSANAGARVGRKTKRPAGLPALGASFACREGRQNHTTKGH